MTRKTFPEIPPLNLKGCLSHIEHYSQRMLDTYGDITSESSSLVSRLDSRQIQSGGLESCGSVPSGHHLSSGGGELSGGCGGIGISADGLPSASVGSGGLTSRRMVNRAFERTTSRYHSLDCTNTIPEEDCVGFTAGGGYMTARDCANDELDNSSLNLFEGRECLTKRERQPGGGGGGVSETVCDFTNTTTTSTNGPPVPDFLPSLEATIAALNTLEADGSPAAPIRPGQDQEDLTEHDLGESPVDGVSMDLMSELQQALYKFGIGEIRLAEDEHYEIVCEAYAMSYFRNTILGITRERVARERLEGPEWAAFKTLFEELPQIILSIQEKGLDYRHRLEECLQDRPPAELQILREQVENSEEVCAAWSRLAKEPCLPDQPSSSDVWWAGADVDCQASARDSSDSANENIYAAGTIGMREGLTSESDSSVETDEAPQPQRSFREEAPQTQRRPLEEMPQPLTSREKAAPAPKTKLRRRSWWKIGGLLCSTNSDSVHPRRDCIQKAAPATLQRSAD